MIKLNLRNEHGFSYVELLVAIVILGLIFNSAFFVYERGIAWWNKGDSEIELQQHLRIALDRMSKDFRRAVPGKIRYLNSSNSEVIRTDGKLELNDSVEVTVKNKSNGTVVEEMIVYKRTVGKVLKNGQPIAENISDVYIDYKSAEKVVVIKVLGDYQGTTQAMETKAFLRIN